MGKKLFRNLFIGLAAVIIVFVVVKPYKKTVNYKEINYSKTSSDKFDSVIVEQLKDSQ